MNHVMGRSWLALALGGLLTLPGTMPARADAIDGHCCHPDGRRLEVAEPMSVTPARSRTQGDDRHCFTYVTPAADPGAGTTVSMVLLNEMTVRIRAGDKPEETWNRRGPSISLTVPRAIG